MLDPNSLAQLNQLKTDIIESKDQGEGEVRGSQRRFGFVKLDDGRDVFLAPDDMQRVFPGDRVKITVHTDDKGKFKAELEKLLKSPLDTFTGRYVIRGQGHFVEPDLPRFNKLLFIPPSQRKKAAEGDLLHCKVSRHPFRDGKSQVNVLARIGSLNEPGVEARYTQYKFNLPREWPKGTETLNDQRADKRDDLRATPFVTIDSAETRDIDDALWAEANEQGWRLQVAVADPGAYILPGSALDKAAAARGTSVYLPGKTQVMFPEAITKDLCSLLPEQDRAALVCTMQVSEHGEISQVSFCEALIRSHAKLSYNGVQAQLDGDETLEHPQLKTLEAVSKALNSYRTEHALIMPEQADFRYELDAAGQIAAITKVLRNDAHRLVEECMLAANRSVAEWFADGPAIFSSHAGLREDRLANVRAVMAEALPELQDCDISTLDGYRQLINATSTSSSNLPLRSIFARMLQPGELSLEAKPHFGLGLERYSTFTSPLRKYNDLIAQRCIRAKLDNTQASLPSSDALQALQDTLRNARQASRNMERWLHYQFLAKQPKDQVYQGHIAHLNGGGFTVELDDTGINGFVEARSIPEKLSFDANSLRLFNDKRLFQLETPVTVKVAELDPFAGKLLFNVVEDEATTPSDPAEAATNTKESS